MGKGEVWERKRSDCAWGTFLREGVLSVFCFCETELQGAKASLRLTTHLDLLRAGTAGVHRQVSFMQGWGLNPAWHLRGKQQFYPGPESYPSPFLLSRCSLLSSFCKDRALLTVASCVLGLAGRAQHTAKG